VNEESPVMGLDAFGTEGGFDVVLGFATTGGAVVDVDVWRAEAEGLTVGPIPVPGTVDPGVGEEVTDGADAVVRAFAAACWSAMT
jgi:hypothetical protein